MRELYTVIGKNGGRVRIMADGHRQHIWNESELFGVSSAGSKKLERLAATESELFLADPPHAPRLIRWDSHR